MPGRLHLDHRFESSQAEPVVVLAVVAARGSRDACHRLRGQASEGSAERVVPAGIDQRVDAAVRSQRRGDLGRPAAEQADGPGGDVGDADRLGQIEGRPEASARTG